MKCSLLLILLISITFLATAQEELKAEYKDVYFTNRAGEKLGENISLEEKVVFMTIETANAIGEKVVITLEEGEDFFYKKKYLHGGDVITIYLKSDLHKEKFVLYNPTVKKHVKRKTKQEKKSNQASSK